MSQLYGAIFDIFLAPVPNHPHLLPPLQHACSQRRTAIPCVLVCDSCTDTLDKLRPAILPVHLCREGSMTPVATVLAPAVRLHPVRARQSASGAMSLYAACLELDLSLIHI